ncbi:MAG TPA: LLM class flavin-dependent oxidoreductase [Solirubrobacteraceae bacterium]|nr:LLM class flavin-dependent oxidoreductase [Solirubrobacteraceae bacterium]
MRFGLFGGPAAEPDRAGFEHAYHRFADYAVMAEELGFASVFLTEHHFTGIGQASSPLTLLAHLAARTTRLRLGTAVTVLPWHDPVLLAEQAATVDVLSNGRLDFGVGRGFRAAEFAGFMHLMDDATERYEEALAVILRAWRAEGRWSHNGRFWHYDKVLVEPATAQLPHPPVWVGAGSRPSLEAAADNGFKLLLDQVGSFETTAERVATYRDRVLENGGDYDPASDVAVTRSLHLVEGPRERERAIKERVELFAEVAKLTNDAGGPRNRMAADYTSDIRTATEAGAIIGDAEECVQRLERLRDGGVEYVLLIDRDNSPETLREFARSVMPRLAAERERAG